MPLSEKKLYLGRESASCGLLQLTLRGVARHTRCFLDQLEIAQNALYLFDHTSKCPANRTWTGSGVDDTASL